MTFHENKVTISEARLFELLQAESNLLAASMPKEQTDSEYVGKILKERDQLRLEVERLRKGRDERQLERDKEREKNKKLKASILTHTLRYDILSQYVRYVYDWCFDTPESDGIKLAGIKNITKETLGELEKLSKEESK